MKQGAYGLLLLWTASLLCPLKIYADSKPINMRRVKVAACINYQVLLNELFTQRIAKEIVADNTACSTSRRKQLIGGNKQEQTIQEYEAAIEIPSPEGPNSPEFATFESVSTDKMVDLFSGDFTYNLPLLEVPGAHGGGYPVNLSYHSGSGASEDVSWVGHGFSISPGSISRTKRGYPDDVCGSTLKSISDMPADITVAVTPNLGVEAFSCAVERSVTQKWNNNTGFSRSYGLSFGVPASGLTLSLERSQGVTTFDANFSLASILKYRDKKEKSKKVRNSNPDEKVDASPTKKSQQKTFLQQSVSMIRKASNGVSLLSSYGASDFALMGMPSAKPKYSGTTTNVSIRASTDPTPVVVGLSGGINGSFTVVRTEKESDKKIYGYLYNDSAYAAMQASDGKVIMMDYHLERDAPPDVIDIMLPVPIADADYFQCNAEGLSGSFRAHWKKGSLFLPSPVKSKIGIINASGQYHAGLTVGGGVTGTGGGSSNELRNSMLTQLGDNADGNSDQLLFSRTDVDEPIFFRFKNDLAGNVLVDNSLQPEGAKLNLGGIADVSDVQDQINTLDANTGRVPRSTTVRAYTNEEIVAELKSAKMQNGPKVLPDYEYLESNNNYINRNGLIPGDTIINPDNNIRKHIGLFSITNTEGNNYVFALPVYTKNERSFSYSIDYQDINTTLSGVDAFNHSHIYAKIPDNPKTTISEQHEYGYATSYLLTSIRAADYKDINNNGVIDEADIGGFTKFTYDRVHGSLNKTDKAQQWFTWRIPHSGCYYEDNQAWNKDDNMVSYTTGEKEMYVLKTIETQTHIALFITNETDMSTYHPSAKGSMILRKDAKSALADHKLAANTTQCGNKNSRMLEKIVLLAKYKDGGITKYKLLKTVNFQYDYSAWPGIINNEAINNNSNTNSGMLTLRKVWIDDQEVRNGLIAPYIFHYNYMPNAATMYPPKYSALGSEYANLNETPNFRLDGAIFADPWGNYQADAINRDKRQQDNVNQMPPANYDPAAWELKRITLPTGAQIHVQYEQDDYRFVQSEPACLMMNLSSSSSCDRDNVFEIDLSKQGLGNLDLTQTEEYVAKLKKYLAEHDGLVFFKFLYQLAGTSEPLVPRTKDACGQTYIDGWVKLNPNLNFVSALAPGKIKLRLGHGFTAQLVTDDMVNSNPNGLPRYLCIDYNNTATGKLGSSCARNDLPYMGNLEGQDAEDAVLAVLNYIRTLKSIVDPEICYAINPEYSYIRLPFFATPYAAGKKGGGLRVKRLLMFDATLNSNNAELYGTEYLYSNNEGSTGVASNEPNSLGSENALKELVIRKAFKSEAQKIYRTIIAGPDKEQFEGPYGETYLPSPSIGYSKVISKSIHSGKTDIGFVVNDFYTSYDLPLLQSKIKIDEDSYEPFFRSTEVDKSYKIPLKVNAGCISYSNKFLAMCQNHRFILSDRTGMPKSTTMYAGRAGTSILDEAKNVVVYKKTTEYFEPFEEVPVVTDVFATPIKRKLGWESEVIAERRSVEEENNIAGLSVDFGVSATVPPVPSAGALPLYNRGVSRYSRLVTSKVISMPTIVKRTTEFKDGVTNIVENYAFDARTGAPIVTTTRDIFDKQISASNPTGERIIYSYTQPLSAYNNAFMSANVNEGKVLNENISMQGLGVNQTPYFQVPVSNTIVKHQVGIGDLLCLKNATAQHHAYVIAIEDIQVPTGTVQRFYLEPFTIGTNFNSNYNSIKVVRSGKRYDLSTPAGSIVTLNKANFATTLLPANKAVARASFIAALNAKPNFLAGNDTLDITSHNNSASSNTALALSNGNCLSFMSCTYGCGSNWQPCVKRPQELMVKIGFGCYAFTSAWVWLVDSGNTVNKDLHLANFGPPVHDSSGPWNTMPPSFYHFSDTSIAPCNSAITATANTSSFNTQCPSCPLITAQPTKPTFLNGAQICFYKYHPDSICAAASNQPNNYTSGVCFAPFKVMPTHSHIPKGSSYSIYQMYDTSAGFKYQRLNFLSVGGRDKGLLTIIAERLNEEFYDRYNAAGCDTNFGGAFIETVSSSTMLSLRDKIWFDKNADGIVDSNEVIRGNESYNSVPPCNIVTNNNKGIFFKTIKNNSGDMYLLMLDKFHTSTASPVPLAVLDPFMQSQVNIMFTLNKNTCSNITPPELNPPSPGIISPLLIGWQKLGKSGGSFQLDQYNKTSIYYKPPNRARVLIDFFKFCDTATNAPAITNVLSNSNTTFEHEWPSALLTADYADILSANASSVDKNLVAMYRPQTTYAYKAARTASNPHTSAANRIYDNGTYRMEYNGWLNPAVSTKWIASSTVLAYNPHGEPLMQVDPLGIASSSILGYDKTTPRVVASNAFYDQLIFEDFEQLNYSIPTNCAATIVSGDLAHTGLRSLKLNPNAVIKFPLNTSLQNSKPVLRFWSTRNPLLSAATNGGPDFKDIVLYRYLNGIVVDSAVVQPKASCGAWYLYEYLLPTGQQNAGALEIGIAGIMEGYDANSMKRVRSTMPIYVDDVVLQPNASQTTCYVYDPAYRRMLASFDANHFASMFTYGPDGKLNRSFKETERGLKMIEERLHNVGGKQIRN